jgi:hypothetical protein
MPLLDAGIAEGGMEGGVGEVGLKVVAKPQ